MKKKLQTLKVKHGQAEFVGSTLAQLLEQETRVNQATNKAIYHAVAEISLPEVEQLLHGDDSLLLQQDQFLADVEKLSQAAEKIITILDAYPDLNDESSMLTEAHNIVQAKLQLAMMISTVANTQQYSKLAHPAEQLITQAFEKSLYGNFSGDESLWLADAAARSQLLPIIAQYTRQTLNLAVHIAEISPGALNSEVLAASSPSDTIAMLTDRLITTIHQATAAEIKAIQINYDQSEEAESIANTMTETKPSRKRAIETLISRDKSRYSSSSASPISLPVDSRRQKFGSEPSSRGNSRAGFLSKAGNRFGSLQSFRSSSSSDSKKSKRGSVGSVLTQAALTLRKMSSREMQMLKKKNSSLKIEVHTAADRVNQARDELTNAMDQFANQAVNETARLQVLQAMTTTLQEKLNTLDYQYINPQSAYHTFDRLTCSIPLMEKNLEEKYEKLLAKDPRTDDIITSALEERDYGKLSLRLDVLNQTIKAGKAELTSWLIDLNELVNQRQIMVDHQQQYTIVANWVAQLDHDIAFDGDFRASLQEQHQISVEHTSAEANCLKQLKQDLPEGSESRKGLNQFNAALKALRESSPDNQEKHAENITQYEATRVMLFDIEPASHRYLAAVTNHLVTTATIEQLEQTQHQFIKQEFPAGKLLLGNLNPSMTLYESSMQPRFIQRLLNHQDKSLTSGQNNPLFEYVKQQQPEKVEKEAYILAENERNRMAEDALKEIWDPLEALITEMLQIAFSATNSPFEVSSALTEYLAKMGYQRPEESSAQTTSETFLAQAITRYTQAEDAYAAAEAKTHLFVQYMQTTNQLSAAAEEMAELKQEADGITDPNHLDEGDRVKLAAAVEEIVKKDDVVSRREEIIEGLVRRSKMKFNVYTESVREGIVSFEWPESTIDLVKLSDECDPHELYSLQKSDQTPVALKELLQDYLEIVDPAHIIRDLIDYQQAEKVSLKETLTSESMTAVNENAKSSLKKLKAHSTALNNKLEDKEFRLLNKLGTLPLSDQETASEAPIWQGFPEISYFTSLRDAITFSDAKTLVDIQQVLPPNHRLATAIASHLDRIQPSEKQLDKFSTKQEWEETKTVLACMTAANHQLKEKQTIQQNMQTLGAKTKALGATQQQLYQSIRHLNPDSSFNQAEGGMLPESTDPGLIANKDAAQEESQRLQVELKQAEKSLEYAKLDADIPLAGIIACIEQKLNDPDNAQTIAATKMSVLESGAKVSVLKHWQTAKFAELPPITRDNIDLKKAAAVLVGDYVKNSFKSGGIQVGDSVSPMQNSVVQQYLFARVKDIHQQVAATLSQTPTLSVRQEQSVTKESSRTSSYAMITQLTGGKNSAPATAPKMASTTDSQPQAKTKTAPDSTPEPDDKQRQSGSDLKGGPK